MIFSIIAFGGSGTPVTLGEEAKLPHKTIGRAVIVSMLITGITLTLAAYALTIGWGPNNMASFGSQLIPGIIEAKQFIGITGAAVLTILGVNSFFNLALSYFNAGIRVTYAIARDGILLPTVFAKVHHKYKSHHYAIFLNILIALLAIPAGYVLGALNTFLIEVTGVTVAYFIYHILTNISLSVYFKRIKELNVLKHMIIPAVASIFFAIVLYFSVVPISFPVSYGTVVIFIWGVIGIIISLAIKKRD
jgi:amino acid transporter